MAMSTGVAITRSDRSGGATTQLQYNPIRVNEDILFKDIFTHFSNELSIGVSVDGEYYVWGLVDNQKMLTPRLVKGSQEETIFNIYAKFAKNILTPKSVVVGSVGKCSIELGQGDILRDSEVNSLNLNIDIDDEGYLDLNDLSKENLCENVSLSDNVSVNTSVSDSNIVWKQWFNSPNNFDIKFNCVDKEIFCHKKILEIRNKKFWQTVSERLVGNQIAINAQNYDVFYAFLQYMYGLEPEIKLTIVEDLQTMAKYFEEPQLAYLCSQYIKYYDKFP